MKTISEQQYDMETISENQYDMNLSGSEYLEYPLPRHTEHDRFFQGHRQICIQSCKISNENLYSSHKTDQSGRGTPMQQVRKDIEEFFY